MDAHQFLHTVASLLACDAARAEAVTFAVFQELRDRLTPTEAADVAAQLPTALKTLWSEGSDPHRSANQVNKIHAAEFIGRVRRRTVLADDAEAERAVRAVFRTLRGLLGSASGLKGEAWDIFSQLPKDMKPLWLEVGEPTTK
jgi:uncharacterized protein (DUF2267 family)